MILLENRNYGVNSLQFTTSKPLQHIIEIIHQASEFSPSPHFLAKHLQAFLQIFWTEKSCEKPATPTTCTLSLAPPLSLHLQRTQDAPGQQPRLLRSHPDVGPTCEGTRGGLVPWPWALASGLGGLMMCDRPNKNLETFGKFLESLGNKKGMGMLIWFLLLRSFGEEKDGWCCMVLDREHVFLFLFSNHFLVHCGDIFL